MAKSAQVDPLEEAKSTPVKEKVVAEEKAAKAAPFVPPPPAAADVPAPPKFKVKIPEAKLLGIAGRMTWIKPGAIVSAHTHSKQFMADLKAHGIELEQIK
jgi:hypothetical protein